MTRARAALTAAAIVWVALVAKLMIADVWDETNGMLAFSDPAHTLGWKLHFVLTQSLGFWRPLPTIVAVLILHFVRDFDVSWRILRALNAAMLLGAGALFVAAITKWSERDEWRDFVFAVALLFSGSAMITAGWYANIFDGSVLLLIAAGSLLIANERAVLGGIVIGIAFFCKETTALALPFLLMLLAARRIRFRAAVEAGVPAAIAGLAYFALRSRIVPFGSASDVHGFAMKRFVPTLLNLCDTFWLESLKHKPPLFAGIVVLVVSLAMLRKGLLIAATLLMILVTACAYWGMTDTYQNVLMTQLNFIGRLYLVPVALVLVALAFERRTIVMALLLVPILAGAYMTYRDHTRFQRLYRRIYRTAAASPQKPLLVDYAEKPLHDTVRGIEIGALPSAHVAIDVRSGRLLYR